MLISLCNTFFNDRWQPAPSESIENVWNYHKLTSSSAKIDMICQHWTQTSLLAVKIFQNGTSSNDYSNRYFRWFILLDLENDGFISKINGTIFNCPMTWNKKPGIWITYLTLYFWGMNELQLIFHPYNQLITE